MFWVCFRRFLISSSLILEGHFPETFALVSGAAEATASARKMSMHPEKIPDWIKRTKREGQPFPRVLGKLFPKEDKLIYPEIFSIYELVSEHGRHPSFESTIFFSDFSKMNIDFQVHFVYSEFELETNLHRAINYVIFTFYKFLYVFKEVFKKYLKKEWVKEFQSFESVFNIHKNRLREKFEVDNSHSNLK